jgi:hypothetical protein
MKTFYVSTASKHETSRVILDTINHGVLLQTIRVDEITPPYRGSAGHEYENARLEVDTEKFWHNEGHGWFKR